MPGQYRSTVVALLAATALVAPASASAANCPDVTFIGARGSGQESKKATRGMGPEVFRMADRMRAKLERDGELMRFLPVTYEAAGVETLKPSRSVSALLATGNVAAAAVQYRRTSYRTYVASIDEGVKLAVSAVQAVVAGCPETDIVMGGYSQGAMVVHQAQLRLHDLGDDEAEFAIVGTLLLADGDQVPHSAAKHIGSAERKASGIRSYLKTNDGRDVLDPEFTVNICDDRDIVCDFSFPHIAGTGKAKRATSTHTTYERERRTRLDKAVDWLYDKLVGD